MITTKQRAKLRAMANTLDCILHIGKSGIVDTTIVQADEALTARELIKCQTLETSPVPARAAAEELAEKVKADIVQVIGRRFVLYRANPEKPQIKL